jgi:uncharacterized protein (TIGR02186 family)
MRWTRNLRSRQGKPFALRHVAAVMGLATQMVEPAQAETMIVALSSHRIAITSNYTGAQLAVFGSVERDARTVARADGYDIVVTVSGPRKMIVVREKEPFGPFWINRTQRRFAETPAFIAVASNRPTTEIAADEAGRRLKIGLNNALIPQQAGLELDPGESRFRNALVRVKGGGSLFTETERGVTFLSPSLFTARIDLPATAPTGNYEVEVMLLAGSVPLARQSTNFELVKTGVEQRIAAAAADNKWFYGLMTVLLALSFGWLANLLFRRD